VVASFSVSFFNFFFNYIFICSYPCSNEQNLLNLMLDMWPLERHKVV
jgi:hypothetical protein